MTTRNTDTTTTTALATLDMGFGDENDLVVKPTLQPNPHLMYMTGNLTTTTFETAVGWHVQAEVNPALDELLAERGTKRYIVQHKSGDVPEKPYWNLNWQGQPCSLFIIAYGVKSTWEMSKHMDQRTGIAYGAGVATNRDGTVQISKKTGQPKMRPTLQLRAFIHELLGEQPEQGFNEWFQVSLSNYMVDEMNVALNAQFRVLEAFNGCMKAKGSTTRAQYWGFSIPMVPGAAKKVPPKGEVQSTIFPMVAQIPDLPINAPATIQYLSQHRIPLHIQERLRGGLLDDTLVWSLQRSLEIVEGHHQDQEVTVTEEEPVEATAVVTLPPLPAPHDPQIDEKQVAWIRDTYCGKNEATIKALCTHFKVATLAELRVSQYQLLYQQVNGNKPTTK